VVSVAAGGGVACHACNFTACSSAGATGGVIRVTTGATLLTWLNITGGSSFTGCSANNGGAVGVAGGGLLLAAVTNASFTSNTATGLGGALYVAAGSGSVKLTFVTARSNAARGGGGAVYVSGTVPVVAIASAYVSGNRASAGNGGGVSLALTGAAAVTITSSTFVDNTNLVSSSGYSGGALAVSGTGGVTLVVNSTAFVGNRAGTSGGGLFLYATVSSTVYFWRTTWAANFAQTAGAVFAYSALSSVTIASSTFTSNYAISTSGGQWYYHGGAVNIYSTINLAVTVSSSTFRNNSCRSTGSLDRKGGALSFWGGPGVAATMRVTGTAFYYNGADSWGGGLHLYVLGSASTLYLANTTWQGNYAQSGGAVFASQIFSSVTIANSTFTSNYATSTSGGQWYYHGGAVNIYSDSNVVLTLSSSTFRNNSCRSTGSLDRRGGALSFWGGPGVAATLRVTGTAFYYNRADYLGGGLYLVVSSSSTLYIANTTCQGNYAQGGALSSRTLPFRP
jgi:predicted outer membrane repeat protein